MRNIVKRCSIMDVICPSGVLVTSPALRVPATVSSSTKCLLFIKVVALRVSTLTSIFRTKCWTVLTWVCAFVLTMCYELGCVTSDSEKTQTVCWEFLQCPEEDKVKVQGTRSSMIKGSASKISLRGICENRD
ncbi:hypothetical protein BDR07DRAFT_93569 [Suillus spraguei]|nr:hypothetical protein BDR07DRAFT_93569 [Suillus spraguei]